MSFIHAHVDGSVIPDPVDVSTLILALTSASTPQSLGDVVTAVPLTLPTACYVDDPKEAQAIRALPAARAVVEYSQRVGASEHDLETAIADLLVDLQHLADVASVDWQVVTELAVRDYRRETRSLQPVSNPTYPDLPESVVVRAQELFDDAIKDHLPGGAGWNEVDEWCRQMWIEIAVAEA